MNKTFPTTDHGAGLKEAALAALQAVFADHSEDGVRKHFAEDVIQHNPFVPTGRDAVMGLLPALKATGMIWTNHRVFQDGDFVFMHNAFSNAQAFGAPEVVSFDIYRMENGLVAEHWDAIQPVVTPTASGRSMVDGPTASTDPDKTEANKALAKAMVEDLLMGKNPSRMPDYISAEQYDQHNPHIEDGLAGLVKAVNHLVSQNNMFQYTKIHKVLGEGDFVLVTSEGQWNGTTNAFYDLLRFANGKAVEHWDVIQPVPVKGLANSNTMFGF